VRSGRVASFDDNATYLKADRGALFRNGNPYLANTVPDLWTMLDASECAEGAITFFHHPAYEWPQPVDWSLDHNAPNPNYETLVEIYSEHGSSECQDLSAPHCDWNLREDSRYWGQGSVQMALALGYHLGFVAGTDSHDSRPGSVEDEPSCTARWSDSDGDGLVDTPNCQSWTGGVTGVQVPTNYARGDLFDAMRARRTIASSGPRPEVRAAAFAPDGGVWMPGEVIDTKEPLRIYASIDGAEGVALELLDADGNTRLSAEGPVLDGDVELLPGEAIYLRARLEDDQRLWVSPWFGAVTDP